MRPAAVAVMEVEDGTFADVDEEANFVAASVGFGMLVDNAFEAGSLLF